MAHRLDGTRAACESLVHYRDLIDDWPAFCDAIRRPLPTTIWANPQRIAPDRLRDLLADEGIPARPLVWRPEALRLPATVRAGRRWWYCAGLAHAQEAASQLPVTLLDPVPGQRVLDMCAAPGGKTAQIACALGNRGTLLANDLAADRIKALVGNLDRLGIINVTVTRGGGANYPAAAGQFDRILVDAPCSSEGTLRRNPELGSAANAHLVARLAARQRALLRKAVQLCRPGGRIVYSTCTFAPDENELVVEACLREQDGRVSIRAVAIPDLVFSPGITHWQGQALDPALRHCLRIWPHQNDSGGFFIAVLEKDPGSACQPDTCTAPLDPDPGDRDWVAHITTQYGLPSDLWRGLRVHRQTRRGLHLVAADHRPPHTPVGEVSGLFFHRTSIRPPKLTTAGALFLGGRASRQRLELTIAQRDAYLARRGFTPTRHQAADLTPGQVLVTYRGFTLGLAVWHRSGVLESLFPRRWSGCGSAAP